MLSNHNTNQSSFRIIEPRHNSQPPLQQFGGGGGGHQLPILNLSGSKTSSNNSPTENYSSNHSHQATFRHSPNNMMYSAHQQQYSHQPQHIQLQQRTRNLSDTDSSYIPGQCEPQLYLPNPIAYRMPAQDSSERSQQVLVKAAQIFEPKINDNSPVVSRGGGEKCSLSCFFLSPSGVGG